MQLDELLNVLCKDQEGLKARFMHNDALIEKFLRKFLEDASFGQMEKAVEDKDYEGIETSSHTLKGVAGNLGLSAVYETAMNLLNLVREKQYGQIDDAFAKAKEAYEEAVEYIQKLD